MNSKAYLFCLSIAFPVLLAQPYESSGLGIELETLEPIELGKEIRIELTYKHSGEEPLFIERPRGFGDGTLTFYASKGTCLYKVRPEHFDVPVESLPFFSVPLLPGDRLTETVTLNDPEQMNIPLIFLPAPGSYQFHAEFSSVDRSRDPLLPFWSGTARSNTVTLSLIEPKESSIQKNLEELQGCLQEVDCISTAAVHYFLFVQDKRAIPLLRMVLQRNPADMFAAQALWRQGDPEVASVLEEAGRRSGSESLAAYYMDLIEEMKHSGPCLDLP